MKFDIIKVEEDGTEEILFGGVNKVDAEILYPLFKVGTDLEQSKIRLRKQFDQSLEDKVIQMALALRIVGFDISEKLIESFIMCYDTLESKGTSFSLKDGSHIRAIIQDKYSFKEAEENFEDATARFLKVLIDKAGNAVANDSRTEEERERDIAYCNSRIKSLDKSLEELKAKQRERFRQRRND